MSGCLQNLYCLVMSIAVPIMINRLLRANLEGALATVIGLKLAREKRDFIAAF